VSPEALPEAAPGRKGVFVAVVGPSGAGKDTVLKAAAGMLQAEAGVHFVRRVVTRAADAACEDHATLSPDDFIAARESGAFCLSWGAHGLFYGLPASIGDRLADGQTVVANLSRTALADAARRFGGIRVEVDVRHLADNYLRLDNSGALQPTVDAFVTHLLSLSLKP